MQKVRIHILSSWEILKLLFLFGLLLFLASASSSLFGSLSLFGLVKVWLHDLLVLPLIFLIIILISPFLLLLHLLLLLLLLNHEVLVELLLLLFRQFHHLILVFIIFLLAILTFIFYLLFASFNTH
jgi:hypothetical protein